MSEQELMDYFPPVPASSVYKRETEPMGQPTRKENDGMLFVFASVMVFAGVFIFAAVVLVVNR